VLLAVGPGDEELLARLVYAEARSTGFADDPRVARGIAWGAINRVRLAPGVSRQTASATSAAGDDAAKRSATEVTDPGQERRAGCYPLAWEGSRAFLQPRAARNKTRSLRCVNTGAPEMV